MALHLYDVIADQAKGLPVEILLLLDNKQRSIGKKREALVKVAQGEYLAFVDDDDDVAEGYIGEILEAIENRPDVVVFDSLCTLGDGPHVRVRHGLEFENEQYNPEGFTRKPWHIHAWRREIAQAHTFPDISYGEDWGWVQKILTEPRTQARAGTAPLYHYRYSSQVSEAA